MVIVPTNEKEKSGRNYYFIYSKRVPVCKLTLPAYALTKIYQMKLNPECWRIGVDYQSQSGWCKMAQVQSYDNFDIN